MRPNRDVPASRFKETSSSKGLGRILPMCGAGGGTRTHHTVKALAPKTSVYTIPPLLQTTLLLGDEVDGQADELSIVLFIPRDRKHGCQIDSHTIGNNVNRKRAFHLIVQNFTDGGVVSRNHLNPLRECGSLKLVDAKRFELLTSSVQGKHSPAELRAHIW